ncbi:hypothetical protein BGY98DRAFT_1027111 [Russula aff. rugulosa BPL654]|nr:hypothetical protein BGY98DRAFT_1027111 [Russula aff. rugulosa BPL654]
MIQQLFDANIMLEDSGSHDFVGALCKLSLEMVSMQSGVDVGAGAGCFGCGGDNIPCETTGATSLLREQSEHPNSGQAT